MFLWWCNLYSSYPLLPTLAAVSNLYDTNTNQKKTEVAVLISHNTGFRTRIIIALHNEKWLIVQEDIEIPGVCAPNKSATRNMRQKLIELQEEMDKSTFIIGDFNVSLSVIDKQKISNDIGDQNSTITQLDPIDIYRILHPAITKCTLF